MPSNSKYIFTIWLIGIVILAEAKRGPKGNEASEFFTAVSKARYTSADGRKAFNKVEKMITNIDIINIKFHQGGDTALHIATRRPWNVNLVELLLKNGANIQAENGGLENGFTHRKTPIFEVVKSTDNDATSVANRIPVTRKILEKAKEQGIAKKVVDAKDENNIPLMWYACDNGVKEIVELLLENGADVNDAKHPPLYKAVESVTPLKGIEIVERILTERPTVDINCRNESGFTPLFHAVMNNNNELVILLIEHNVDARKSKMTPEALKQFSEQNQKEYSAINAKLDLIAAG